MRRIMLALLLLAAACGGPTEGERDFALTVRRAEAPVEAWDSVNTGLGAILMQGAVTIDCSGGRLTGELQRPAPYELVFITRAEWPAACEPPAESFEYSAIVRGLRAGEWHLQVMHTSNSELAPPRTVFQESVIVY